MCAVVDVNKRINDLANRLSGLNYYDNKNEMDDIKQQISTLLFESAENQFTEKIFGDTNANSIKSTKPAFNYSLINNRLISYDVFIDVITKLFVVRDGKFRYDPDRTFINGKPASFISVFIAYLKNEIRWRPAITDDTATNNRVRKLFKNWNDTHTEKVTWDEINYGENSIGTAEKRSFIKSIREKENITIVSIDARRDEEEGGEIEIADTAMLPEDYVVNSIFISDALNLLSKAFVRYQVDKVSTAKKYIALKAIFTYNMLSFGRNLDEHRKILKKSEEKLIGCMDVKYDSCRDSREILNAMPPIYNGPFSSQGFVWYAIEGEPVTIDAMMKNDILQNELHEKLFTSNRGETISRFMGRKGQGETYNIQDWINAYNELVNCVKKADY